MINPSTYPALTHTSNLCVGLKGNTKSECGQVACQIKGKEVKTYKKSKHFDLTHIPDVLVRLNLDIEIVQISLFFIEISTDN